MLDAGAQVVPYFISYPTIVEGMDDRTKLVTEGRDPLANHGVVNPPVYHASTILFPTLAEYERQRRYPEVGYGRYGTSTTFALYAAIEGLEGGGQCLATGSGKAAIAAALLALLSPGDHMLVADTVYAPTRVLCTGLLARFGVETTFYDARIGTELRELIRPTTKILFLESPGSLTFEVQDVPLLCGVAKERGLVTVMDNTWATPLFFKPFAHGVDVSIMAATKYIGGHSDLMMGLITSAREVADRVRQGVFELGSPSGPDDVYLALRGLRTLAVRLAQHQASALRVAEWLAGRPEVARVMHPALPDDPGHALWRRDFSGASGLLGFELRSCTKPAVAAMVDGLELFGIGASWGGYESLVMATYPEKHRSAVPWDGQGPCLRLHIGLESPDDLIADLEAGFARLRAAA